MNKLYIICPNCGKKLFRIDDNSKYDNIYIWCKCCKKEIKITEPRAKKHQ